MESSRAIVIRTYSLTESSLIVVWCSEQFGLIKTVAKGAKSPKSKFAGQLDLFYLADIDIVMSRKSDLHQLREMQLERTYDGVRTSFLRTLMASYFASLLAKMCEPEHAEPRYFDLICRALNYLENGELNLRILEHFENQIAEIAGIREPNKKAYVQILDIYGDVSELRNRCLDRL
ncbi:DNA repair protein RecO [Persicirhabdus sediminis]|uniref:DNA repair protein RecO n=1 Tax=Persicirhabdus sediminis TaxID=454144 RepID=A0A8J7MDG3_9BACT|nr:DNA repair protein RecO [Persicirhabdus sediminis]MBK1791196.1 DNA repair protein RecO [Persicirhabdus sediminis]